MPDRSTALVLSGGVALGSYQAGIYEALARSRSFRPPGSPAVQPERSTALLIAGTSAERRCEVLRSYWLRGPESLNALSFGTTRHALNWASAIQSRLFGAAGSCRTSRLALTSWPAS